MKILIITSGRLSMPNIEGGAIEGLVQEFLNINEETKDFTISVMSKYNEEAKNISKQYDFSQYIYLSNDNFFEKIFIFLDSIYTKLVRRIMKKEVSLTLYSKILNKTKKIIKKNEYDKIIILNSSRFVLPIRKIYSGEIILYLHNDYLHQNYFRALKIYQECNKIFTVSEYIKDQVLKISGSEDKKVSVILNGRNLDDYNALELKEKDQIRTKFGIKQDDVVIIFSGRLHRTKGIYELIMAIKKLDNLSNVKLLILGGTFYSSNKKDKFTKLIKREIADIQNHVVLTGYIDSYNVPKLLLSADIGVVPSMYEEASGLSVMEMQAAGLPLISTYSGGIPEISSAEGSILLDRDDEFINNLSLILNDLIINKNKRETMGREGILYMKKHSVNRYFTDLKEKISENGGVQ